MKTEIKVNGTNFKFVKLTDYCKYSDHVYVNSDLKKRIYYQRLFFTRSESDLTETEISENPKLLNTEFNYINIVNVFGNIYVPKNIRNYLDSAWVVIREKGSKFKGIKYNEEDIRLLISLAGCSTFYYLNLTEGLLLATKCKTLIDRFYSIYGKENENKFINELNSIVRDEKSFERLEFLPVNNNPIPIYDRNRYSVYSLLEDLVKDKAKININKDIVGNKYTKISSCAIFSPTSCKINNDGWGNITSLKRNKKRANISINMDLSVSSNAEEKLNLKINKTFCIIKDGTLWQKRIAVNVSKTLEKKLKRYDGLVENELLMDHELLLDLSKLPIISKSKIHCTSLSHISKLSAKEKLSSIALEYLEEYIINHSEFKELLSIIYPSKSEELYRLSDKDFKNDGKIDYHEQTTVISSIPDINVGVNMREKLYNHIINGNDISDYSKRYEYKTLCKFLQNIPIENNIEKLEKELKFWKEEKDRSSELYKKEILSLIFTKSLKFDYKTGKRKIKYLDSNIHESVNVYGIDLEVYWSISTTKIETRN